MKIVNHLAGLAFVLRSSKILRPRDIHVQNVDLFVTRNAMNDKQRYHAKMYQPRGDHSALPCIYLQHGMTITGIQDPRMDEFARNLASSGCRVIMPEMESLTHLRIDPGSIDEIESLFIEISSRFVANGAPCAFASAGFSAGMGLAALSRPSVREKVASVLCIGAYGNFKETVKAAVACLDQEPYGAFLVLANSIQRTPQGSIQLQTAFRECASRTFLGEPLPGSDEFSNLNESEKATFDRVVKDFDFRQQLILDILSQFSDRELKALSPLEQVEAIRGLIVLIHGKEDASVPASESEELAFRFERAGSVVRLVVTTALSHADRSPIWKIIPEVPRLASVFGEFLGSLKGKVADTERTLSVGAQT